MTLFARKPIPGQPYIQPGGEFAYCQQGHPLVYLTPVYCMGIHSFDAEYIYSAFTPQGRICPICYSNVSDSGGLFFLGHHPPHVAINSVDYQHSLVARRRHQSNME